VAKWDLGLVFAADRWITGPVLGEADQFHPLGYPYDSAPPAERSPLDLDANPTLDDVLEVRAERTGFVDSLVRDATDESLARVVDSPKAARPPSATASGSSCSRSGGTTATQIATSPCSPAEPTVLDGRLRTPVD
jgi:hypothetical protein